MLSVPLAQLSRPIAIENCPEPKSWLAGLEFARLPIAIESSADAIDTLPIATEARPVAWL